MALSARGGRSGFDLQAMVIVVELEGAAVAYPVPALRRNGVINDELAGVPIAAVVDPRSPDRWNVSRRTGSGVAELTVQEQGIHDAQSDTVWDPACGAARRQPLLPIPALTSIPAGPAAASGPSPADRSAAARCSAALRRYDEPWRPARRALSTTRT